jgi:hypothetical protein
MAGSTPRRRVERAMTLTNGKPMTQAAQPRECAHPSCTTQLSRYNPNPCCSTHGGWLDQSTRRNRDLL